MKPTLLKLIVSLLTVFVTGAMGAVVPINLSQVGTSQKVTVTAFANTVCVNGIGCGGSFDANVGTAPNKVVGATIWCVDSQLTAITYEYTAYIQPLALTSGFDDPNKVRYGGIVDGPVPIAASPNWIYDLTTYGTFGTINPNSAQTRFQLAAILVSQYTPQIDNPANVASNQAIQVAIWRLTENNLYPPPPADTRLDDGPTGTTGAGALITNAINKLKTNTFDFSRWALISGVYDGGLSGTPKVQTFLVQVVTPEPQFYGLLLIGLLAVFGLVHRKQRRMP